MKKIKIFNHSDLDAIGITIVAKKAFELEYELDIEYCNYNDINQRVRSFWDSPKSSMYERMYITDISVSDELANHIDISYKENNCLPKPMLIDHHKTALGLNKYMWCHVQVSNDLGLCSGTSLVYDELFYSSHKCTIKDFVEIVRKYDTWEFSTKYNDDIPKLYNDLFMLMGKDDFIKHMMKKIDNCDLSFTEVDEALLYYKQKEVDYYIATKKQYLTIRKIQGYNVAITFSERYTSELGHNICSTMPEIDFVMMINPSYAISYRTNKDIDLTVIAKSIGGDKAGGHVKASGSPIPPELKEKIIDILINKESYV